MAGLYGNLLINDLAIGFNSPEELIRLLIFNDALDEFLEMVKEVEKETII